MEIKHYRMVEWFILKSNEVNIEHNYSGQSMNYTYELRTSFYNVGSYQAYGLAVY